MNSHRNRRPVMPEENARTNNPPITATDTGRVSFLKKVLQRGTITIPADVLEAVGVEEGDIVEFEVVRIYRKAPQK